MQSSADKSTKWQEVQSGVRGGKGQCLHQPQIEHSGQMNEPDPGQQRKPTARVE